jgi:hypothetical protein
MEVTRGRARDVAVVAGARAGQLKSIQEHRHGAGPICNGYQALNA